MRRLVSNSQIAHCARCLTERPNLDSAEFLLHRMLVLVIDQLLLHLGQFVDKLLTLFFSVHQSHLQTAQHFLEICNFLRLEQHLLFHGHELVICLNLLLLNHIFFRENGLLLLPRFIQQRLQLCVFLSFQLEPLVALFLHQFEFSLELLLPFSAKHDESVVLALGLIQLLLAHCLKTLQLFRQSAHLPSRLAQLLFNILVLSFLHCDFLFQKVQQFLRHPKIIRYLSFLSSFFLDLFLLGSVYFGLGCKSAKPKSNAASCNFVFELRQFLLQLVDDATLLHVFLLE